ncbi:MAG TPA: peptidylprolyl isomerase [Pyrinomonadaceae bacterium]|nr:peptidylprolyl isomerase [Pyrinomonadaceae bacterium]
MKILILPIFCLFVLSFAVSAQTKPVKKTNSRPEPKKEEVVKGEPFDKADVATMASKCVKFETELGDIEMEMFPESAPETVRNFLNLVAIGAYDTTTFSRVVPDFVVQGGSLGTREKFTQEWWKRAVKMIPDEPNQIKHTRGILSMARGAEANSASTSFFILMGEASHLDGTFAAFGRVTKGMEIAEAINKAEVKDEAPLKPVRLKKATIFPCQAQTEAPKP